MNNIFDKLELFRDNLELAQFMLKIITGKDDLVLTSQGNQHAMNKLFGAHLCLDVSGTDSAGKHYRLQIFKAEPRNSLQIARCCSSMIDAEFLCENPSEMPITYTIFVMGNDHFGAEKPLYQIERVNTMTGKPFDDGKHILYVNGAYDNADDHSDIAKLIHDFRCRDADDMYFDVMADALRYINSQTMQLS